MQIGVQFAKASQNYLDALARGENHYPQRGTIPEYLSARAIMILESKNINESTS